MINIQKLLRHSIEKQKLRPVAEVRQLIYEKMRLAIKSKLMETNAPDFIKRTYMLRLEAAICEVEAFYFLKPEYFVLKDNKIPFHFAYQAYLPDYFCIRQDVLVDPASLRWLTTGQKTLAHLSFQDDDPPLTDAELFEFRTHNTANNRANVFNDKSRIIDLADRKVAHQSHTPLSHRAEVINCPSHEHNVYPDVNNDGETYLEGQPVNVSDASIYGEATTRKIPPRREDVREDRQTYYVPQPSVNEQQINTNTRNNDHFSDRSGEGENDRRPLSVARAQLQAETRQNGGANASQQANSHQISQEQTETVQRAYSGVLKVQGYDEAARVPFSQPSEPINFSFNSDIDDYSSLPNIFFIDKTSVHSNLAAATITQPNSTGLKMPADEQKRELEQQFFKRETVVMATPSPSPQIAETVRFVPNDINNQKRDTCSRTAVDNGIRPASTSQDNAADPNSDMDANFNPAVSRGSQHRNSVEDQPSESLFAKVANNDDELITEPLFQKPAQALNTQADTASDTALQASENPSSKIPEPLSFLKTRSGTVARQNALDDDGIKASETTEDKDAKDERALDNGNLSTFNEIKIKEIPQEDETRQKFSNADDGAVDDNAPIPDFIVKYDKEHENLFDRLEKSPSPSRPENQPRPTRVSQVQQEHQLQSKPLEQDLLPKFSFSNKRYEKKPALYKILALSLYENLRSKGSIAAGVLLACVASSGAYYFLRSHTPVSTTTINNEVRKQNADLSQTAAISLDGSLKQNSNNGTGSNSKELAKAPQAKTPQYDMPSQPLDQTRKDVSLPSVVAYPSNGHPPYQKVMMELPRNDGSSGVIPQETKTQTKFRVPASMLVKDKQGMPKKLEGSVLWSLVPPHSSDNTHDETALVGDFVTEDGLLDVRMTIRKNYRKDLDATHLIDLAFLQFDGFEAGPVVDVRGIYFGDKVNVLDKQAPATVANLSENNFVASLLRTPDDREYNKFFIGRAAVLGFPATFRNGKTALFVFNKGSQNQEIFDKFNENSTH